MASGAIAYTIQRSAATRTFIEVPVTSVQVNGTDQAVVAAPGVGQHLLLFHLSINNGGANDTELQIMDGSSGSVIRNYMVAKNGGTIEVQFQEPVALTTNTALWYNWISGASADINISAHTLTVND